MKKLKIGLIGCGAMGREIARAVDAEFKDSAVLLAITDIDEKKTRALRSSLKQKPDILTVEKLIKASDLIIEAASAKASGGIAKKAVANKKDILIMSVGGIIGMYPSLFARAKKNGCRVYLPSGAVCGLDGVKAAALGRIDKVELTTRKPPEGLKGAPFVEKNKIDLDQIKSDTVIFEGSAREAIRGFPANINVSCVLSIAGIGPNDTRVKIIASAESRANIHEIIVQGAFGKLTARTENVPSPANPKTSHLAILSAIAVLRQIFEPAKVGT